MDTITEPSPVVWAILSIPLLPETTPTLHREVLPATPR